MESITKIDLDKFELDRLVKHAFGSATEINNVEEFVDGWFNTIYSIQINDGREVVLKISPRRGVEILSYEKNIMFTEVEVLRLLKASGTVPVPKVYFYDDTRALIENEYFFMEKVSGQAYSKIKETLSEKEREHIEFQLGFYNKAINNIKGERFGYFAQPDKQCDTWAKAFHIMVKDILADGKAYNVKLPLSYEAVEKLIIDNLELLAVVTLPSLIHWDLHDGNIIIDGNHNIGGIIDCDRALWGDPLIEVYFGSFADKTYFCKGYGEYINLTREEKQRRGLYNIYLYLIMTIECEYRGYDEGHRQWTYKLLEDEIREFQQEI